MQAGERVLESLSGKIPDKHLERLRGLFAGDFDVGTLMSTLETISSEIKGEVRPDPKAEMALLRTWLAAPPTRARGCALSSES